MTAARESCPAASLFLVAGMLAGLVYLVLFPPFSIADEPSHFARGFALSNGELLPRRLGPRIGSWLPASLERFLHELHVGEALPINPEHRLDHRQIVAARHWPLEPQRRTFIAFPNAAQFPFVPYVPQALGIAAGRACGAQPLLLIYLARLSNLLVATLITWLALKRVPIGRWPMSLLALTPMAVSTRASASSDALTTALAFLFLAAVAGLAWRVPPRPSDRWLLLVAGPLLCLTKLPYALLLLTLLVVPRERLQLRRYRGYWASLAICVVAAIAWSAWTAQEYGGNIRPDMPTSREEQVRDALREPGRFLGLVVADYARFTPRYLAQLVGAQLGWLDLKVPLPVISAYLAVFLALLLFAAEPIGSVRPWQRLVLAAEVVLLAVVISASQYAVWTPYRADFIAGVQGRYFLPLAPLAVFALHRRPLRELPPRALLAAVAILYLALTALVCWRLVHRYYG